MRVKHGGRQKGTPNKSTAEVRALIALAATSGATPLEVMLADMRAKLDAGDLSAAADRAENCAPYIHSRLSAATVVHKDAFSDLTVDQLIALIDATGGHDDPDGEGAGESGIGTAAGGALH